MTDTLLACLEYFVKVNTSILSKGWIKLMVWGRILKTLEPVCQVPTMDWTTILLCGLGLAAGYWVYLQFYYIFSFSFVYLVNYHRKHESLWPFKYFYTGRFWTNLFHLTERDGGSVSCMRLLTASLGPRCGDHITPDNRHQQTPVFSPSGPVNGLEKNFL